MPTLIPSICLKFGLVCYPGFVSAQNKIVRRSKTTNMNYSKLQKLSKNPISVECRLIIIWKLFREPEKNKH